MEYVTRTREPTWRLRGLAQPPVEAKDVATVGVNRNRQDRSAQWESCAIANHNVVQRRVIDLDPHQGVVATTSTHVRPASHSGPGFPLSRGDAPIGIDIGGAPLQSCEAACTRLHDAGFELVCVSALDTEFEASRLQNLRALGYPIERVYATPHDGRYRSPKADKLAELRPTAFVDDYLPYLRGVQSDVHTALITRGATSGPNTGPEMALAKSTHLDLAGFADFWLQRN